MKQGHKTTGSAPSSKTATSSLPTLRLSSDLLMNAAAWIEEHICTPASKKVAKAVWKATEGSADHAYLRVDEAASLAEHLRLIGKPGATSLADNIESCAKRQKITLKAGVENSAEAPAPIQISDLSVLLKILTNAPGDSLTVTFDREALAGLKGCLELGVSHICSHIPGILSPRMSKPFVDKRRSIELLVSPDAFALLQPSPIDLQDKIKVTASVLKEGFPWIEEVCRGKRIQDVLATLEQLTDSGEEVIEAPFLHVQEIADWLGQIIRNEPNNIAENIRQDVEKLNGRKLGKIDWGYNSVD